MYWVNHLLDILAPGCPKGDWPNTLTHPPSWSQWCPSSRKAVRFSWHCWGSCKHNQAWAYFKLTFLFPHPLDMWLLIFFLGAFSSSLRVGHKKADLHKKFRRGYTIGEGNMHTWHDATKRQQLKGITYAAGDALAAHTNVAWHVSSSWLTGSCLPPSLFLPVMGSTPYLKWFLCHLAGQIISCLFLGSCK